MPHNEDEESMNAPDPDPPCTPPKLTGNGGAGQVDPDGQMESEDDDSYDLQVAKPCFVSTQSRRVRYLSDCFDAH